MIKVKNQFEIENIEEFIDKHENKSVDELLELLATEILSSNPGQLKAGMRAAGYDVDNMQIFEGVNDVQN